MGLFIESNHITEFGMLSNTEPNEMITEKIFILKITQKAQLTACEDRIDVKMFTTFTTFNIFLSNQFISIFNCRKG